MQITGQHILGAERSALGRQTFHAFDPRTQSRLEPAHPEATSVEIDRAARLAARAHPAFERAGREARAAFLEGIAAGIEALGPALLERASLETGLAMPRLESERGRTTAQLRMFARVVREGGYLGLRIDHGDAARQPVPKPDVRSMARAIGPVAVFGASNFPLAFSVAGGDSASALAAGCPIVVKAHPSHPGTSELVGCAIASLVREHQLPEGVFSLVHGAGNEVGAALVEHPEVRAVAFTGSHRGGRALFDLAARRESPIPVFAEMGSVNPVFLLPARLDADDGALARAFAASLNLGAGQFCTNPGVVVAVRGAAADAFVAAAAEALALVAEQPMLNAGIRRAFDSRLDEVSNVPGVTVVHRGEASGPCGAAPTLMRLTARAFLGASSVRHEIFGPGAVVVLCDGADEMVSVARALAGQLTATVHAAAEDEPLAVRLVAQLEQRAGRVLYGGFPTGVEVCEAMVHGGPYPATTDARTTSVGAAAIARFTRPVAYQGFPDALLPAELRDDARDLWRRVDGEWIAPSA